MNGPRVCVTGADGYIGRLLIETLARRRAAFGGVTAMDVRETPPDRRLRGVEYIRADVRDPDLSGILSGRRFDAVVHLASIVMPTKRRSREFEYSVDVVGTRNVLRWCAESGVKQLIVTSSGAAYGYHADNPVPLRESDAVRGNRHFPYAYHKRLIERTLECRRGLHSGPRQLILRVGTILGKSTHNAITDLFDKPVILGVSGHDAPFVFIWDRDLVEIILKGVLDGIEGVFNVAGDGWLTTRELAQKLGKPYVELPARFLAGAIRGLGMVGLTQYGPEQVDFLRYRPVLSNERLKSVFGYVPKKTSEEVFEYYQRHRSMRAHS